MAALKAVIETLKLAKVIELHGSRWVWSGAPGTVFVQLGDQTDRLSRDEDGGDEDSEVKCVKFYDYLDAQAKRNGSRVLSITGNHCWLAYRAYNDPVNGLAYVSPKGLAHFGGPEGRIAAFRPGGEMAMYMANHRYAVLKIGPFLVVHGAVLPHIPDKYTIPQINQLQRDFLTGKTP